ncbi:lactate utilization protein C [Vibrio sp. JC009]|uniref:LutC/YkgG family protein n=1 Tax=Vibrio sp. JC009 TaxID=2912314 RepID=UPI0023B1988F|nr:lactate utilization protein C [Vibrio sp. JC009]WED23708.1 lactate utilization protein C [Vibrio sp. JC009]
MSASQSNTKQGAVTNRDTFVQNIADKLGRSKPLTCVERPAFRHNCHHEVMADYSQDELQQSLTEYARTTLGAQVIGTNTGELEETLRKLCLDYCDGEKGETMVSASASLLNLIQPENLASEEHTVHVWEQQKGYKANITIAERAKVGIVMAEQALAESGTMVLYSRPEQGRAVSLLPETSIFVVAKSTLIPRLTQATSQLHQMAQRGERIPSCVNFISGPSSTADIELIKVVGVHGPVAATYVIIEDM